MKTIDDVLNHPENQREVKILGSREYWAKMREAQYDYNITMHKLQIEIEKAKHTLNGYKRISKNN